MTGSRWPFALVALIVGVVVGAGGFSLLGSSDDDAAADQDVAVETTLVAAEQRDLQRFDEWAGTLQPGPTSRRRTRLQGARPFVEALQVALFGCDKGGFDCDILICCCVVVRGAQKGEPSGAYDDANDQGDESKWPT